MAVLREDMTALPQATRLKKEADRIYAYAKLAAQSRLKIELYNHNGWFGIEDNQLAIIDNLKKRGIDNVGIVYNFAHARDELHDDTAAFPDIWARIRPHVAAVIITGMGTDKRFIYPSQGDSELEMMRVMQQSGWRGPIGLIAEQGGDAEVTLRNDLVGFDWLAAELRRPGSGGRPFPDISDVNWRTTVTEPVVVEAENRKTVAYPWGSLSWYVSGEMKNSDTMTVGEAVIKPGKSTPLHFHPNCDEVLHILKGRVLQTLGRRTVEMREGDTVSIPIGVKHGTRNIGTEDAVVALSYSSVDRHVIGE